MAKVTISDEELSKIMEDVNSYSVEQVRDFLETYQNRQEERRRYNQTRNMTDEQKRKRKEYNRKRRERENQIIARAKELGLI